MKDYSTNILYRIILSEKINNNVSSDI